MSTEKSGSGMTVAQATRLEYAIIGLGLVALVLIFQPFSLALFSIGCALVVVAGLVNNLLPLCEPGVRLGHVGLIALIVALIFLVVLLIAVASAHLYGVYFVGGAEAVSTTPGGAPFYQQTFIWIVAGLAVILASIVFAATRGRKA
jgi:hypothetical protein